MLGALCLALSRQLGCPGGEEKCPHVVLLQNWPCLAEVVIPSAVPVPAALPAGETLGLSLQSTPGRGGRTTSPPCPTFSPRPLVQRVSARFPALCPVLRLPPSVYFYQPLSHPLVCTEYFEYKIKLLCSTRAKQSGAGGRPGPVAGGAGAGLPGGAGGWRDLGRWLAGPGPGPADAACPGPPAPLVPAVTCRAAAGPPAPSLRASLRRAERRERPRSQHEHPQGLQHLGHRIPGDQISTERSNQNPRWEKHQVRAGGYIPGQRSPGGDEGEGRQPQSHSAPDRQRGPLLRGLRALCGSGGAKHPAGVPEAGLSPGLPSHPGLYLHS